MGKFVLMGIAFVVVLYAFIDVIQSRSSDVRTFPRPIWAIVVIVLPVLGALGWFVLGRPRRADAAGPGRRPGPVAPDDDPTFLRELEDKSWSEQMRQRRERTSGTAGSAGAAGSASAAGSAGPASTPADPADSGPSPDDRPAEDPRTDGPAVDSGSPGPVD